ncbi:MAG: ATP-binding cassette domain-containing protein [Planctomycetales bacterium]|nr:ATP-binding cassette domain-containing protein [Planctomycetales bacterium]
MITISDLLVAREGQTLCSVAKLSLPSGGRLAVVGSNGSGKTTLLRVLANLEDKYQGSCQVDVGNRERTFLHQQPYLFRGSVLANVRFGEQGRGRQNSEATKWLERLGIGQLAHRTTQNLSGGEARRVALARTLARRARLLLLDEPLADLDPKATADVCQVLNELRDTTLILTSPCELPDTLSIETFNLDHESLKVASECKD